MVTNEKIGRYRLDGRLGAGSFATVWLGYDPELEVLVSIKVLAENWSHNLDVRERFLAEARLLRRVRDQRIVRVHDIGTLPDDRPYFGMDYADGGTVGQLIPDHRPPPGDSLRLGAEIARAVQVLHGHGVAHRDIKPGNLLLTSQVGREGRAVVVADLGMAKSLAVALAGDPEDRPASAGALADRLEALVGGGREIVPTMTERPADDGTVVAATGATPAVVAMSGLVVAILVAAVPV